MPSFPEKITNFSWSMVNDDEMKYYSADEIIDVVKKIYQNYTKEIKMLNSNKKRLDFLHNLDNRIPNQILWEYYSINKKNLSFIFS
jgi:predicted RND superfamily exporter protein